MPLTCVFNLKERKKEKSRRNKMTLPKKVAPPIKADRMNLLMLNH